MVTGIEEETSVAARSFVIRANGLSRKGCHAAAEALYQRALALVERTLGTLHPVTAEVLECYADLLAKTNRQMEATAMKHRAEMVWRAYAPRFCRAYSDVQLCCLDGPEKEGAD
jgi:hypothetical protein